MNINNTKVAKVEEKGTYTNINTKEKYIAMPCYLSNNGEDSTLKYGLKIPRGIYKGKGKNNYFIKEYDISDDITSVEPVRYSKTSPLYFKQGSNIYYRKNGSLVDEEERAVYFVGFRSNCEDLKDVLTITIDWALSTIMEAINSLPLEYSIKFKEGKYLLDERNNKYITIKENGKFKITFE